MDVFETESIMTAARELCRQDSKMELKEYGPLPPCRKTSPLTPSLRMNEYEMMERDKGKCKTYVCVYVRSTTYTYIHILYIHTYIHT